MSDSNIGWIDRAKMKAALEALRSNQRSPKRQREAVTPNDDFVDLFGVERSAPYAKAEPESDAFVQPVVPESKNPEPADEFQILAAQLQAVTPEPPSADFAPSDDAIEDEIEPVSAESADSRAAQTSDPWIRAVHDPASSASNIRTTAPHDTVGPSELSHAPKLTETAAPMPLAARTAYDGQSDAAPHLEQRGEPSEFGSAPPFERATPPETEAPDDDALNQDEKSVYDREAESVRDFVGIGRSDTTGSQPFVSEEEPRDAQAPDTQPTDSSELFGKAFAVLRGDSVAPAARHADQEVGYESAFPELTRSEPVEEPMETSYEDDDDEDARGLSPSSDDLDLNLGRSAVSKAPNAPVRDAMDITAAPVFDGGDFESLQGDGGGEFADLDGPLPSARAQEKPPAESARHEDVADLDTTSTSETPDALPLHSDFRLKRGSAAQDLPSPPKEVFDDRRTLELPAVGDEAVAHHFEHAVKPLRSPAEAPKQTTDGAEPVIRGGWLAERSSDLKRPAFEAVSATEDYASKEQSRTAPDTSFSRVSAPAPQVDDASADEHLAQESAAAAPQTAGPRIEPSFLGKLRWRRAPQPDDFSSVLTWLEGLSAWVASLDDNTEFFVGDESGLPLIQTTTDEGVIAISVALRQSMSILHRLHNDEAPGFTVFRHDNQRYMNILWSPTEHGVLSVGIISDEVFPDDRLELLLKQLEHAVEHLPFID